MFVFIETRLFSKLVQEYLTDDEYASLQRTLVANPDAGSVIRGSGGVRKMRWALAGQGKRGGYRIIYFLRRSANEIWMLTMYPKNVADAISGHVLRKIREEIEGE
jgi:hypothetical protein